MSKNKCASITWVINNFKSLWQKNKEAIISPIFYIYLPEETKWKLKLFPCGTSSNPDCISYFLCRDEDCNGAENIEVEYSLEILSADDSILASAASKNVFQKDSCHGFDRYLFHSTIVAKENEYLPLGNLTLNCRITQFVGKKVEIRQISAHTTIDVEKQCSLWPIKNFSTLTPNQKQAFAIQSPAKKVTIHIGFYANKEDNICINIYTLDQRAKSSIVKTVIIDSQQQKMDSGEFECRFYNGESTTFPLNVTKKQLMDNEGLYLPNDTLTLSFELIITLADEIVEKVNVLTETWQKCIGQEQICSSPCALLVDLASLHGDQSSCDMKLQTKTNVFPVHTLILSARSPVFKAMFSSEMKEKVNGCVDVSDLDDETVGQFILYLYTDQVRDFNLENALQLYRTADKYAVFSLKEKCSTFLKYNLSLENALDILILADLHQDKDLKLTVQKLILRNAKLIFKSEEWKLLADTNSKLVVETMLQNWIKE